jgi:Cyclic nucleotide-binding domain
MNSRSQLRFGAKTFLPKTGTGRSIKGHAKGEVIFSQADPADALFYIHKGKVKLTVVSNRGKQAVIAILGRGDFFGEGCLAGQLVRMSSCRRSLRPKGAKRSTRNCSKRLRDRSSWVSVMPKHNAYSMFLSILNEVILAARGNSEIGDQNM